MRERTYVGTAPVFAGKTPWYLDVDVMNVNQGWSVSVMAQEPERILTFMDTMLSEYWQIIIQWGEEGIDYYVNAEGIFYRDDEQRRQQEDLLWQQNNRLMALLDQMPKIQGTYPINGNATSAALSALEWQLNLVDYDREFLNNYNMPNWRAFLFQTQPTNPPWYPAWQAPLGDGSPAQVADQQMNDWNLEFLPQVIIAPQDQFEAMWQQYVDNFDRIDVAAYEAAVTAFTQQKMAEIAMP
jgi:putative aldouronate transport system substrate-binding protein